MDCQIINGAADDLARVRPALFFEYDPDLTARAGANAIEVFDRCKRSATGMHSWTRTPET